MSFSLLEWNSIAPDLVSWSRMRFKSQNVTQLHPSYLCNLRMSQNFCLLFACVKYFLIKNSNHFLEDHDVEAAPALDKVQHEGEGEGAEG